MSGTLEPSPFYNDFRAICSQNEEIFAPWSGVIFRSISPRYARTSDILSGQGAYQAGGRWNAPGIYAIYGSLEPGFWLETSNSAFEGSTPVQVIERGESDRIWRMIWELRGGNSGD
jgi:hypothetical protein